LRSKAYAGPPSEKLEQAHVDPALLAECRRRQSLLDQALLDTLKSRRSPSIDHQSADAVAEFSLTQVGKIPIHVSGIQEPDKTLMTMKFFQHLHL